MKLDELKTLTGESLVGALNALDEKLPDGAYKPVTMGGRTFTDISPAYSTEEIDNHFGPLGIGWGYAVTDEHYNTGFATNSGKGYVGVVLRVDMWFAYTDGTDTHRAEWTTYGGNANAGAGPDEHFAWQGALTNALGKGWSLQGFQRTIYKGEDFGVEPSDGGRTHGASGTAPKPAPVQVAGGADPKVLKRCFAKATGLGDTKEQYHATIRRMFGHDEADMTQQEVDKLLADLIAAEKKAAGDAS